MDFDRRPISTGTTTGSRSWADCVPESALAQAQAALAPAFQQWVASTAANDREQHNLPELVVKEGAGGLDTLRRAVLAAAVRADDDGGIDPGPGMRQCRQSAAGARRGATARNRAAAEYRRGPASRRAATADRERAAGIAGRSARRPVRDLGDSFPDAAAGERPGELHAARGIELARARAWRPHVSVLTGILFGLAPAMQATRVDVMPALKETHEARTGARAFLSAGSA